MGVYHFQPHVWFGKYIISWKWTHATVVYASSMAGQLKILGHLCRSVQTNSNVTILNQISVAVVAMGSLLSRVMMP